MRNAPIGPYCNNCDDGGWVCEGHPDKPWDGTSKRSDACGCGPGRPCDVCNEGLRRGLTGIETVICSVDGKSDLN